MARRLQKEITTITILLYGTNCLDIVMKITCDIMVLIARATDCNNIFHQIDSNLVCVP